MSTRGHLSARKRARDDAEDEGLGSASSRPTKRLRQAEELELRFRSFTVTFGSGNRDVRIHSTSYGSVNRFPDLVRWAREKAPQLRNVSIILKTNFVIRNEEFREIFRVPLGSTVERVISDQGSWNAAVMASQANRLNDGSYAGLLVLATDVIGGGDHLPSERIAPDYTGEDEGEGTPERGNRPAGTREAGGNSGVGGTDQSSDSDNDLYTRPGR